MNISPPACPPVPTEQELLHSGRYYEVNIESLRPQEIVIVYVQNHPYNHTDPPGPYIRCMRILGNPSGPGRIRWCQPDNDDAFVESLITYVVDQGFRFFKRDEAKNFRTFLEEQNKFHSEHDNKIKDDNANYALRNLGSKIGDFLQPKDKSADPRGGKKYKRTKRTNRSKKMKKKTRKYRRKNTRHIRMKYKKNYMYL